MANDQTEILTPAGGVGPEIAAWLATHQGNPPAFDLDAWAATHLGNCTAFDLDAWLATHKGA